ncbi:MAG: Fe-S cluster assembly protein SufD [Kiloniellales bacterium]
MSVETMTTAKSFADLYMAEKAGLPGAELPWLAVLRDRASQRLLDVGLPTSRLEQWRYTPALANRLGAVSLAEPAGETLPGTALLKDAKQISVKGGRVVAPQDLPQQEGVSLRRLADLLAEDPERARAWLADAPDGSAFDAINLALLEEGLLVEVAANLQAGTYVIDHSDDSGLANLRLEISLQEGASLTLVERLSGAAGLKNHIARMRIGPGARLTHVVLLEEGADATQLSELSVAVERDARYQGYLFFAGSGLSRRAVDIDLLDQGAEAQLDGAYMLDGRAHGDLTSHIRHAAPDTNSKETVKGALNARARQVFRGKITVEEGASRADGRMANKTLLLSDQAEIDSKPELMIFHDEVQCAHGATAGKLDQQALFYLRSRGIPLPLARKLLLRSFLQETLEGLKDEALIGLISERLDRRLEEIAA